MRALKVVYEEMNGTGYRKKRRWRSPIARGVWELEYHQGKVATPSLGGVFCFARPWPCLRWMLHNFMWLDHKLDPHIKVLAGDGDLMMDWETRIFTDPSLWGAWWAAPADGLEHMPTGSVVLKSFKVDKEITREEHFSLLTTEERKILKKILEAPFGRPGKLEA